ncbi:MAG: OB-fold nucleic acid binding domain-containing protein [Candidatus Micrarchaeia archaeon]
MISKNKAEELRKATQLKSYSKLTVKELNALKPKNADIVTIEDNIYRIFNKITFENNGTMRKRRVVALGDEGVTVRVTLWDKSSEFVDTMLVQRGDRVLISNLKTLLNNGEIELTNTPNTYISRVSPTYQVIKTNFSDLNGDEKNIDILGRILSVGPIRYFRDLDGKQNGISECSISDGSNEVKVTLWKSSSVYAAEMHPGSYVKIEFANVKKTNDKVEITANDYSRILLGQGLSQIIGRQNKKY